MGLLADGMLPWQPRRRVVRPQVSPRSPAPRLRPPGRHTHPVADPAGKPRQCRTVHTDNAAGRRTVRRAAALTGALMLVTVVGCWSPDRPRRAAPARRVSSGRGRSRRLVDQPSPQRAVRCRPADVSVRSGLGMPSWTERCTGNPGDREPSDRRHGERHRLCPVLPRMGRWCGRCRWVSRCPVRTCRAGISTRSGYRDCWLRRGPGWCFVVAEPLMRGTHLPVSTWPAARWCCAARSRLRKVRRSRTTNAQR